MTTTAPETTVSAKDITHWAHRTSGPTATEWWATRNGTTVAYMKTLTYADDRWAGARFVLCDIEVREGYRGQGLVTVLLAHAQAETGLVLHTSGGYTPKGAAALTGRLPVLPGNDEGVKWDDMTFVHDWDAQIGPR